MASKHNLPTEGRIRCDEGEHDAPPKSRRDVLSGRAEEEAEQVCISSGVVSWQSAAQAYRNTRPIIRHDGGNEGGPIYRLSLGTNVPYASWLEYGADLQGSAVFCSVLAFLVSYLATIDSPTSSRKPRLASWPLARSLFRRSWIKELRGRVDREIAKVENRVRKSLANKIKEIA
jgi:hypothetical protein